jgi:predicted DNA-binding transcriptional regulator AlpA
MATMFSSSVCTLFETSLCEPRSLVRIAPRLSRNRVLNPAPLQTPEHQTQKFLFWKVFAVNDQTTLSDDGYMSPRQVRAFLGGVSDMFIRRAIKSKNFPVPVKFSGGKLGIRRWLRADVVAWCQANGVRS